FGTRRKRGSPRTRAHPTGCSWWSIQTARRPPSASRNGTVDFSKLSPPAKATSSTATRPSGGAGRLPGCSTNTTRTASVEPTRVSRRQALHCRLPCTQHLPDKMLKPGLVTEKEVKEAERKGAK